MLNRRCFTDTDSVRRICSISNCIVRIGILAAICRLAVFTAIAQEPSSNAGETQKQGSIGGDNLTLAKQHLAQYRAELGRFRNDYGGTYDLPDERFFLFGMGLRSKFLYKRGILTNATTGATVKQWEVAEDLILPSEYMVVIRTGTGEIVRITEDEKAIWIEKDGLRETLPETSVPVRLPRFTETRYPALLRVLHQELLVNVTKAGPVPNFFVYPKPWYRDGAMMALCFQATGNLNVIHDWILALREPYDRNNNGESEADNLGQALFLVSLISDKNHPLVPQVLAELPKFEVENDGAKYIKGRSDFAEHPAYQTKWLKYGLRALGLPDPYTIPKTAEGYSALFWMDYKDAYVPGKDAVNRGAYPYLGWAIDHFHGVQKSPISNRDYPLTWEARASQAIYSGIRPVSERYVENKVAAPHTWHAAEIFLYLLENKPGASTERGKE